jgi:UPF0755 protein
MLKRLAIIAGVLLVAAGATVAAGWYQLERAMHAPIRVEAATDFVISPGQTFRGTARRLQDAGMIDSAFWLSLDARLHGVAHRIQAGEYRLEPGMTVADVRALFVAGKVRMYQLAIIEGWTAAEAVAAVRAHPAVTATLPEVVDARSGPTPWLSDAAQAVILEAIEAPESHLEGLFFPDTYRFPRGTTDVTLLRQAYDLMQQRLAAAWRTYPADGQLDSPYELLILASIIEKETGLEAERRRIAGVFARRLARGMRLQTDPTVIYGIGARYDGDIRRRDLQTDTPYNTYTRAGLPPTPIALAGAASLAAAADPESGPWLFFVATGDGSGSHYFSETNAEHEQAVRRYLDALRGARQEAKP